MPRKLSEASIVVTMPKEMKQQLERLAARKNSGLGPLVRSICQEYIEDQVALYRELRNRGKAA